MERKTMKARGGRIVGILLDIVTFGIICRMQRNRK